MKRILALFLLCGMAVSLGFAEATPFADNPDAIDQAAASVVELDVFDAEGELLARASGFVAFSERMVVTAAHVVSGMDHLYVCTEQGGKYLVEETAIVDPDADVALCILPKDAALPPLPCAETEPRRGERAVAIGNAKGALNLVTKGDICGVWDVEGLMWLLFTAPVSAGASGGALFDAEGNVTGVIIGTYDDGQNLNLAAPIAAAQALFLVIGEEAQ